MSYPAQKEGHTIQPTCKLCMAIATMRKLLTMGHRHIYGRDGIADKDRVPEEPDDANASRPVLKTSHSREGAA